MVFCSICSKGIVTNFNCNFLGSTHLKIGMSAYLLNDAYVSNKNVYQAQDSFQIFCIDCYVAGHYHKKIIDKYPEIIQKYAQNQINTMINNHNKALLDQKTKLAAVQQQLNRLRNPKNEGFEPFYRKFEQLYKGDEKKSKSIQTFRQFGKQISLKDFEFKKRMEQFHTKLQRQFVNSSIIRIQFFFKSYIRQIDKKLDSCQMDMNRVKNLQNEVLKLCSQQKSHFHQDNLINKDRLNSMAGLFKNQINNYQKIFAELKKIKSEGILQLNEEELDISKAQRSKYQMSDAQMHEKLVWKQGFFEAITL